MAARERYLTRVDKYWLLACGFNVNKRGDYYLCWAYAQDSRTEEKHYLHTDMPKGIKAKLHKLIDDTINWRLS